MGNESPRVATSSIAGRIQAAFYGPTWPGCRKAYLPNYCLGILGVEIPTYVRNSNSTVVNRIDSAKTVTNEKRLNGFLESKRDEIEQNDRSGIGYIPGG